MFPKAAPVWVFLGLSCLLSYFAVDTKSPLSTHTDSMQATFQQIFRFSYSKQEDGTCIDLSTYRGLLVSALDMSEKYLLSLCTVQNQEDMITGQLEISDIKEQNQTILVNISLVYDQRPAAVYQQCQDLVAAAFQRDDGEVTAPFRNKFSPLVCPAIVNSRGGVLVYSGYFCRLTSQVLTQIQPGGSSHPFDVCVYCPLGEEVILGSRVCSKCRQGFYKSSRTTAQCEPCPQHFVTRINGSTTKHDCQLRACQPGHYADVYNSGLCTPCTHGTYQPEKWTERCVDCPAGFTTYQPGADSQHLCLPICPPGQELSGSRQSCQPCPLGSFNDGSDPARLRCRPCSTEYITARAGATSSRDCNVRNCTEEGQYLDERYNVCIDCPRGQWQNRKWQTSCIPCEEGFTTRFPGTKHPSYCFILVDQGGFKMTKEEIILSMVSVLVLLTIGNLTIVGYCLYTRRRRQKEHISPTGQADIFKLTDMGSRRTSGTYADIGEYATIRDTTPCAASFLTSTSTFKPAESSSFMFKPTEEGEGSSNSYDDFNVYLQPRPSVEYDSEEPIYDDIVNTCPIYQNFGSRSPLASSDPDDEVWSSRLDVLY